MGLHEHESIEATCDGLVLRGSMSLLLGTHLKDLGIWLY